MSTNFPNLNGTSVWGTSINKNRFQGIDISGSLDISGGGLSIQNNPIGIYDSGSLRLQMTPYVISVPVKTGGGSYTLVDVSLDNLTYIKDISANIAQTLPVILSQVKFLSTNTTDTNINSNLEVSGNLIVKKTSLFTGDVSMNSNIGVLGNARIKGDAIIDGSMTITGSLYVAGTTTYINTSQLQVQDKLITLNQAATLQPTIGVGIEISGNNYGYIMTDSVDASTFLVKAPSASSQQGTMVLQNTSDNTVYITKLNASSDSSFNGNLFVSGPFTANSSIIGLSDASINGRILAQRDASFNSNIWVSNLLTANGRIIGLSDASINGRIMVQRDASFNSNIWVSNLLTANSRIIGLSDASINGRIMVQRDASFNANLWVSNTLTSNGIFTANNNIIGLSDTSLNGRLLVQKDGSFNANLWVSGNLTSNGTFTANSNIIGLSDTSLNGRLLVQKDGSFNANLWVSNTLTSNGTFTANNNIIGLSDTSLNGRILVQGDASFNANLWVSGNLTSNGTFTANSNIIGLSDTSLNGRLLVQRDGSFNSNLWVSGNLTANSRIIGLSDTSLNGRLLVQRDASFNANLFVSIDVSANGNLKSGGFIIQNLSGQNIQFGSNNFSGGTITTAARNTAIGLGVMTNSSLTGSQNVGVGQNAFYFLTSGTNNAAVGHSSLYNLTSGNNNTAFGVNSLLGIKTTTGNSAYGMFSGRDLSNGNYNVFMGYNSGQFFKSPGTNQSDNNIFIGSNSGIHTDNSANSYTYLTCIGANSGSDPVLNGNNRIILGSSSGLEDLYLAGNSSIYSRAGGIGIGKTGTSNYALDISGNKRQIGNRYEFYNNANNFGIVFDTSAGVDASWNPIVKSGDSIFYGRGQAVDSNKGLAITTWTTNKNGFRVDVSSTTVASFNNSIVTDFSGVHIIGNVDISGNLTVNGSSAGGGGGSSTEPVIQLYGNSSTVPMIIPVPSGNISISYALNTSFAADNNTFPSIATFSGVTGGFMVAMDRSGAKQFGCWPDASGIYCRYNSYDTTTPMTDSSGVLNRMFTSGYSDLNIKYSAISCTSNGNYLLFAYGSNGTNLQRYTNTIGKVNISSTLTGKSWLNDLSYTSINGQIFGNTSFDIGKHFIRNIVGSSDGQKILVGTNIGYCYTSNFALTAPGNFIYYDPSAQTINYTTGSAGDFSSNVFNVKITPDGSKIFMILKKKSGDQSYNLIYGSPSNIPTSLTANPTSMYCPITYDTSTWTDANGSGAYAKMAISDDGKYVYIGSQTGIYRSGNGGVDISYVDISKNSQSSNPINVIHCDSTGKYVVATTNFDSGSSNPIKGLFFSTNYGQSFKDMTVGGGSNRMTEVLISDLSAVSQKIYLLSGCRTTGTGAINSVRFSPLSLDLSSRYFNIGPSTQDGLYINLQSNDNFDKYIDPSANSNPVTQIYYGNTTVSGMILSDINTNLNMRWNNNYWYIRNNERAQLKTTGNTNVPTILGGSSVSIYPSEGTGSVGINTLVPSANYSLDISGNTNISGNLRANKTSFFGKDTINDPGIFSETAYGNTSLVVIPPVSFNTTTLTYGNLKGNSAIFFQGRGNGTDGFSMGLFGAGEENNPVPYLQSMWDADSGRPLYLNPLGGTVNIGNITADKYLNTYALDVSGDLRIGNPTNPLTITSSTTSLYNINSGADITITGSRVGINVTPASAYKLDVNGDTLIRAKLGIYSSNNPPFTGNRVLDISGSMRIYEPVGTDITASTGSLVFEHGDDNGVSSILFESKNSSDYAYIKYDENLPGTGYTGGNNGALVIGIEGNTTSTTDRICLMGAGGGVGPIGINTLIPGVNYSLDISGNLRVGNPSNQLTINSSSTLNTIGTGSTSGNITISAGSTSGNITISAGSTSGNITISAVNGNIRLNNKVGIAKDPTSTYALDINGTVNATSYNATSDYRIKTNVIPLEDTHASVDTLRPVSYFNTLANSQDYGFIAHEVAEYYPFLVSGQRDVSGCYQSLNYTGIIPILVKDLKQTRQELSETRQELNMLRERLDTIINSLNL